MFKPYQILGVDKNASQSDIKKSFRKLTQQYHPDKNPDDKSAENKFKEVSQAYEVLGDEDKRKLFDEFGEISLSQGFDAERARAYQNARGAGGGFPGGGRGGGFPGGGGGGGGGFPGNFHFSDFGEAQSSSFDDLLSQLFGGGRASSRPSSYGGAPRSRKGQDIEGEIGIGLLDSIEGTTVPLRIEGHDGDHRTIDVKVPSGIADGGKLRLRGQGGPGSPKGDVLLTINVKKSKHLRREGQNLYLSLPITALEAYRGGPIDVPTPWGEVTMKIPPGTKNGQALRLKGKGVQQKGKSNGDLMVTMDVQMPPKGDEKLLEALEALQSDENPRKNFLL